AAGGATECSRWSLAAAEVVFELSAAEAFPARKGKRLAPGWWWSAITGRLVHYGSVAVRLHVMLLDRDPRVSGLAARPLELRWHVPRRGAGACSSADAPAGQGVLADCTGSGELSGRQRSLAAVVGEICTAAGWRYWVLGPVGPVYRRNVTWLAGYRHPRHHGGRLPAAALQEAFAEPAPLWEGVRGVGDPLVVLPALFHALWVGRLAADLGAAMHERMPVCAQAAGWGRAAGCRAGWWWSWGARCGSGGGGASRAVRPKGGPVRSGERSICGAAARSRPGCSSTRVVRMPCCRECTRLEPVAVPGALRGPQP
ncbi:hypothetical protein QFZ63_000481, partial [Streptomyces sp. B3I7]|nr:hypothetical protein [Streptomyces sp. B3I7]